MRNAAILSFAVVSVAVVSAQSPYLDEEHKCAKPNSAYCAGSSLGTDIIIRCDSDGKGQPGRCSNNLAGQPPLDNSPSLCWQTDENSGDAACEKNCVVYGSSGNANGTFTLPADICTPSYAVSSIAVPTNSTGGHGTGGPGTPTSPPNGTTTETPTGTLIPPTKAPPNPPNPTAVPTAGAKANAAAGVLAAVGLAVGWLL